MRLQDAECDYCGEEVVNPFNCNYCGGSFCSKHRLPPNHDCSNIKDWGGRSGPSIGSHEKKKSWIARKKETASQNISLPFTSQESEGNQGESSEYNYSEGRVEGEVKFYNQKENYGFIIPEDGEEDVYFKGKDVKEGWLEGGETVEFTREPSENHRGENPRARNVVKLKKPTDHLRNGLKKLGRGLKNEWTIRIFSILVVIGASAWIFTLVPWSRLAARLSASREFLNSALLLFGFFFAIGFVVGVAEKKKKSLKFRGEVEVPEGAEVTVRGPQRKTKKPPSRGTIKWVLIAGIIITMLGFVAVSFGPSSLWGYVFASIGGFILGIAPGLLIKRFWRT